jgi:F-type H+-transporting ATPase subunit delta
VTRVFGGKILLDRKVEPELMGGVRVRVGNRVMDASLRARLEKLRAALKGE